MITLNQSPKDLAGSHITGCVDIGS